jgi:ABC-type antimicrobial peptide transport system permease subunit
MLRALGFKSTHLIAMITLQSFFYSVPGVIAGIAVAFAFNVLLKTLIFIYAGNAMGFGLSQVSLIIGISFGFIMPIISIYFPIKAALDKNLRQSLDLNHRQNNEMKVEQTRMEDLGLSPT